MRQIEILTEAEREAFDSPPTLNAAERKRYFRTTASLKALLDKLRAPANQAHFVLGLGYFKATGRFFGGKFHEIDAAFVFNQLGFLPGVVDMDDYDGKATASRHRKLILEQLGCREFDDGARQDLTWEIRSMVRSQVRPKSIFLRLVEFLKAKKTEVPSAHALTDLITQESKQHQRKLTGAIEKKLSSEQRELLDALLEKDGLQGETPSKYRRYALTLLKRFSQSTKPSKIKANVDDLHHLRALFRHFDTLTEELDLTREGIRYYAQAVIKSQVFQIARRAEEDRYLHLVCFIAHQFFRLHDALIDTLLVCAQNSLNTCKREHKERHYEERGGQRQSVKSLVEVVQQGACAPLTKIERIVFCDALSDDAKVRQIQDVLISGKQKRLNAEQQVAELHDQLVRSTEDSAFYEILEARSIKLQNRVADIVQAVDFIGDETTDLMAALRYFKEKEGRIGQTAPTGFLHAQEQEIVLVEPGKLRTSLYKALLFLKIAESLKAGALNVRHSYKYRSLDDYLLPKKTWQQDREDHLKRANLTSMVNCQEVLASLTEALDTQFRDTNRRIAEGENPHVHFHKDGAFHVVTPKVESQESEALASFFPDNRYVSLLEVLATVNRISGFIDEFRHWRVRHNRAKPLDRIFYAGILAYGCFIGTRKMARISKQINESELDNTVNWYFSLDNVQAANDRILKLIDHLELPQLYRHSPGKLHTSSDGQKFEVGVDSLNANYSFKYFGQDKGATAYTFLDERHLLFHSTVFSSAEREAAYVVDGLMHNDVVRSDIHSTDTHGYSEAVFAVTHLLGFSFAPRIKNLKKRSLYAIEKRSVYDQQGCKILPNGSIRTDLIERNWDEILRFVATIKLKVTTASQLFKRLSSYAKRHPLWQGLKELGKVIRTIFILKYIDDVDFRQRIEKQLNKGESSNRFSRAVSFGNNQEFLHGEKVEQEIAEGCQRLIKNAVICWNYVYLSQQIAEAPGGPRRQELIDAVRMGSVVSWRHINLHGEYDFSDEQLQDSIGLRVPKKLDLPTP